MAMKNSLPWLFALLLSGAAQCAFAQGPATKLRYAFAPGQRLTVAYEETNASSKEDLVARSTTQATSVMRCSQTWVVRTVTAEGDATIDMKYDSVIMRRNLAPGVDFVFDLHRSIFDTNPSLKTLSVGEITDLRKVDEFRAWTADELLGRTLTFTVSNTGKVKIVIGFGDDAWSAWRAKVGVIIPDPAKRAQLDQQIESVFGEASVARVLSMSFFVGLPSESVSQGQGWSDSTAFVSGGPGDFQLPMKRQYKLVSASKTGAVAITERIVYDPPIVPSEITVRQNENSMTADIALDPASGMILSRTYTGLSDADVYRREAGNSKKIMHSVVSVKGAVTIASSERSASSGVYGRANSQKRQGLTSDAEAVTDRRGDTQFSATVIWSSPVRPAQKAQLHVRGNLTRLDMAVGPSQPSVYLVVDKDKQTVAVVVPSQKIYASESTTGTGVWADFYRKQPAIFGTGEPCAAAFTVATNCKSTGQGVLSGRAVAIWEAVLGIEGKILTGHIWVDSRLGRIIKVESPGGSIELQDVQEVPQPMELFTIPSGYTAQGR